MTSKRELRAEIARLQTLSEAGFDAWCDGFNQGRRLNGERFDPAPWQAHLAQATDLARKEGYEQGYKDGRETCTHAETSAKIPHSPSQPLAVPEVGSDHERAADRKNPEWLATGDDYRAAPWGVSLEKSNRGVWVWSNPRRRVIWSTGSIMLNKGRR